MFVRRDESGKIVEAVTALPEGWVAEELPADDPDLIAAFTLSNVAAVSRRQFFQQAAVNGIISEGEALAAVTTGTLPAPISAFINALPAEQRFGAQMLFSVNEFQRSSPMANAFGQAIGMTSEQIDAFFTAAAQL